MIKQLYLESKEVSRDEFSSSDPALDVFHQLFYFCCPNVILDKKIQEDISRYVYCEDTMTKPYPGNYGDVPAKWTSIHFTLKNTMQLRENEYRKKYQRKMQSSKNKKGNI
tara:strand:+ start:812 stop:1141 length:330 start_codon:yes stop_codon:yes gene_type:complete